MPTFTEKSAVEDYIIEKLVEEGWRFVPAQALERESLAEPLLERSLASALRRINGEKLTEGDINRILVELKSLPASIHGTRQFLRFFRRGVGIKLEKSRELMLARLVDLEDIAKNEFVVSRQVSFEGAAERIRADLVLYVNGMPLVLIECKNPADASVSWRDAYRQVKEYESTVPELFKYVQFSIAAEQEARYFPNVREADEVSIYRWRAGELDELEATLEMLRRRTLLDILANFTFVREERGRITKVLPRYMQYEAANMIYERVLRNLRGEDQRNHGLVWHWQGSGKTLTMIFAALKLYRHRSLENPTIFFVVDRVELQEQLRQEFSALDVEIKPEVIDSIAKLREVLSHDSGRGKRGIFITLIHKFQPKELEELARELEAQGLGETIATRKNVIAFIDEGHRTQYGLLASQMKNILRNAFFFAFTGTPISKKGRDTFLEFAYPDKGELYLHKYFVLDSLKDGFTLPIVFQTRMESDIVLRKNLLRAFLEYEEEEIPEELKEEVEKKISRKLDKIKVVLSNPRRIKRVASDIAEHFLREVDGKFKAMVVAVNRASCVHYKRELDTLLPKGYVEVVMTYNRVEKEKIISDYLKELRERFPGKDVGEIKEEIVEKFKNGKLPKILVVTDMLLTGFDAPVLQVMYLDKPLKGHRLLQSVARTNRPYRSVKEAGLIIDYVGILAEFEKALEDYEKQDVEGVLISIDEKAQEFVTLLGDTEEIFQGIDKGKDDRATLMSAVKLLAKDEKKAKLFLKNYRKLRNLFEFLGSHPVKAQHASRFGWLTQVYIAYSRYAKRRDPSEEAEYPEQEPKALVVREKVEEYYPKTLEAIHRSIEVDRIKEEFPILRLDEDYLEKLSKAYGDAEAKIYDMIFTLNRYVLVDKASNPVYEPIAERVERIIKKWKQRKLAIEEAYSQLEKEVKNLIELEERKKRLKLSEHEYLMLVVLEERLSKAEELIQDVKGFVQQLVEKGKLFQGWSRKSTTKKEVGRELMRFLRRFKDKLSFEDRKEIHEKIMQGFEELD
jgi:type I restriction enzyme R subunit